MKILLHHWDFLVLLFSRSSFPDVNVFTLSHFHYLEF